MGSPLSLPGDVKFNDAFQKGRLQGREYEKTWPVMSRTSFHDLTMLAENCECSDIDVIDGSWTSCLAHELKLRVDV